MLTRTLVLPFLLARVAAVGALAGTLLVVLVSGLGYALPRGPELVYAATRKTQQDIYLLDVDRGLTGLLSNRDGPSMAPAWSPDGKRLAFASNRGAGLDIYVMEHGHTRQLTDQPGGNTFPVWSPDGERIAFVSYATGAGQLYVIGADGSDLRQLTQDADINLPPAWSADSRRILFVLKPDSVRGYIHAVDVLDGARYDLTRNQESVASIALSPDGQEIAFTAGLAGRTTLHLMEGDGDRVSLTRWKRIDVAPAWSPDGGRIAFSSYGQDGEGIFVLDTACARLPAGCPDDPRLLTQGGTLSAWSPDGRYLAYVSSHLGSPEIFIVETDNGEVRRLTWNRMGEFALDWRP